MILLYEKPFEDFALEKPSCWVNYFPTAFVRFVLFKVAGRLSIVCGVIMFCSSNFHFAHGFSYVRFSTGSVAFANNMGWVLVFVLEFENALNFLSLPQDVDQVVVCE